MMVTSTFNELVRTFLAEFPGFPRFPSHVFHRKFSIKDFSSKCNQIRSLLSFSDKSFALNFFTVFPEAPLPISIYIYGITKQYSIENGQLHVTTVSLFHQHRILTILKHVIKKEISGTSGTLIWWKYVKSVYDVITRFIKRFI